MTITTTHWASERGKRWERNHSKWTGSASDRAELETVREGIIQNHIGRDISLTPVTEMPDGTIELVFSCREVEG